MNIASNKKAGTENTWCFTYNIYAMYVYTKRSSSKHNIQIYVSFEKGKTNSKMN